MRNITFKIEKEIFEKHSGYRRTILIVNEINKKTDISKQVDEIVELAKSISVDDEKISAWREAFLKEGMKARDYRASIDALVKRIAAGKPLSSMGPVVDIGTIISLKYILPAGAHPILYDTKEISLERTEANEVDITLSGEKEIVEVGEIILRDTGKIATRRWVWRQTPLSRIDNDTNSFYLNIDAMPIISDEKLEEIIIFTKDLISKTFGVDAKIIILNSENNTQTVEL